MTRQRPIVLLCALALIWGSSFMFIKVADREVEPSTLILGRLALAAVTLAVVVPLLIGRSAVLADARSHWRPLVFVGVALLVGAQPHAKLLGAVAVVGMALCYAVGGLLTRRYLSGTRPHVIAL